MRSSGSIFVLCYVLRLSDFSNKSQEGDNIHVYVYIACHAGEFKKCRSETVFRAIAQAHDTVATVVNDICKTLRDSILRLAPCAK